MERVKKITKKISIVFAAVLMFGTIFFMNATETEAATTLHTFFKQEGQVLKFGFKDAKGKVVVKPQYLAAGHFSEGLCPVSKDGNQWSYINTKGKEVFRVEAPGDGYYTAGKFENGVAIIDGTQEDYLINKTGKRLNQTEYSEISRLLNGYFQCSLNDGTCSILNKKGEVVVTSLQGSVSIATNYGFLVGSESDTETIYNIKGKKILSTESGHYALVGNAVWYRQTWDAQKKTIYNWSGEKIGETKVSINMDVGHYQLKNTLFPATGSNGKLGYVDCKGKFVIKPIYNKADEFTDGLALVYYGKGYRLINEKGKTIVTYQKDVTPNRYPGKFVCVEKSNPSKPSQTKKYALMNTKGKYVWKYGKASEYGYQMRTRDRLGFISFKQKGKWGLMSAQNGKVIVPAKCAGRYDFIVNYGDTEQYISVTIGSKTDVYEIDGTKMGSYKGTVNTQIH